MSASNFPTKNNELNTYFEVVLKYMNTHKVRLKIDQDALDGYVALYGDTVTPGTWAYVCDHYFSEIKRTRVVTRELRNLKIQMKQCLMDIYNDIPAALWNMDDRSAFGRTKGNRKKKYTKKEAPIADTCQLSVDYLEGGMVKFRCRTPHDISRPSLAKGASAVEIAIKMAEIVLETAKDGSQRLKHLTGNWHHPEKAPVKLISTKATFIADLGYDNIGKRCEYFARWVNLRRPKLNGPWSAAGSFPLI